MNNFYPRLMKSDMLITPWSEAEFSVSLLEFQMIHILRYW